jgi:hypothetical protein
MEERVLELACHFDETDSQHYTEKCLPGKEARQCVLRFVERR